MPNKKTLEPKDVTPIVDTREQTPVCLDPLGPAESGTLQTGDYTVKGLEDFIRIERKSLPDFWGCVGHERDRFNLEMGRMMGFPSAHLVIEGTIWDLENQDRGDGKKSKVSSSAAIGSLCRWSVSNKVQIHFVGTHERAGVWIARLLWVAAKKRWEENWGLCEEIMKCRNL